MKAKSTKERSADCAVINNRVLALLEKYGSQTNAQLSEAIGCSHIAMRARLARLKRDGAVHSEIVPSATSPFMALYHLGPDEGLNGKEVRQRIVKKWMPPKVKHDQLLAAFFGLACA